MKPKRTEVKSNKRLMQDAKLISISFVIGTALLIIGTMAIILYDVAVRLGG